jgi:hypothetical protein
MASFLAFTSKYNGVADRIITEIRLSKAFSPKNVPSPLPPVVTTAALWDTGATKSVITPSVAKDLGVVPVGTVMVNSVHGASQCNTYLVNLYLPNKVAIPGVLVSECADTAHFGAIIGMDVIGRGDFSITNVNGKTWVSFRIPSIAAIDYVDEAAKLKAELLRKQLTPKVGRNEPCPCGSGKKYKKCCGT